MNQIGDYFCCKCYSGAFQILLLAGKQRSSNMRCSVSVLLGFPGGVLVKKKKSACQYRSCKRSVFGPWAEKLPWSRKWQLIPVFWLRKIPQTEDTGGLWSRGLQRVGRDCVTKCTYTMHTCLSFMRDIWRENLLALAVGQESPQTFQLWLPTVDTSAGCQLFGSWRMYFKFNVVILPYTSMKFITWEPQERTAF